MIAIANSYNVYFIYQNKYWKVLNPPSVTPPEHIDLSPCVPTQQNMSLSTFIWQQWRGRTWTGLQSIYIYNMTHKQLSTWQKARTSFFCTHGYEDCRHRYVFQVCPWWSAQWPKTVHSSPAQYLLSHSHTFSSMSAHKIHCISDICTSTFVTQLSESLSPYLLYTKAICAYSIPTCHSNHGFSSSYFWLTTMAHGSFPSSGMKPSLPVKLLEWWILAWTTYGNGWILHWVRVVITTSCRQVFSFSSIYLRIAR